MPTYESGEQREDEEVVRGHVLNWFSRLMLDKLRANAHKGNWRSFRLEHLRLRVQGELTELDIALDELSYAEKEEWGMVKQTSAADAVIDECRDAANFLMMIADSVKEKYGLDG